MSADATRESTSRLALAWNFSTASSKPSGRTLISISPSLNSSSSSETWKGYSRNASA